MNNLEKFLELPDVDDIVEEVFINDRLGTFKIRAMSSDNYKEYQRKGNMNKLSAKSMGMEFDNMRYWISMIVGQVIYPNFADPELLKKANCATAEQFISKKLFVNEIIEIVNKINEISGQKTEDEDVQEAKN